MSVLSEEAAELDREVLAKTNVYRINADQFWMAESLKDAMDGASLLYGVPVEAIMDELAPATSLGSVARLVYELEPTDLERSLAKVCLEKLRTGYMPPIIIGVLKA